MADLSKKAAKLLKTLADIVSSRLNEETKNIYENSFKNSNTFIVAKVGGEVEFIPDELVAQLSEKKAEKIDEELQEIFGDPIANEMLDQRLSIFYKKYNLKRDIDSISDEIKYYFKPKPVHESEEEHPMPFFNQKSIKKLSEYAGQAYMASDPQLKKIGKRFFEKVVEPTNYWLDLIEAEDFTKEPERYWQVAGLFKTYTWGKLLKPNHKDKRVFFSFGIDFLQQRLFYNLDCQRSGSNKLSTEQIRKFDYFIDGRGTLRNEIKFKDLKKLDWNKLVKFLNKFVKKYQKLYDEVISYIWYDEVIIKNFKNKLIEVKSLNDYQESDQNEIENLNSSKLNKKGNLLIINFERWQLERQGKTDLAKKVKFLDSNLKDFDILSYQPDGNKKWIRSKTITDKNIGQFSISKKDIQLSIDDDQDIYFYLIFDYKKSHNSGKLIIKKGDFNKFMKLEPETYRARLK